MTGRGKPGGKAVSGTRQDTHTKEKIVTSETGQRSWEELGSWVTRFREPIWSRVAGDWAVQRCTSPGLGMSRSLSAWRREMAVSSCRHPVESATLCYCSATTGCTPVGTTAWASWARRESRILNGQVSTQPRSGCLETGCERLGRWTRDTSKPVTPL